MNLPFPHKKTSLVMSLLSVLILWSCSSSPKKSQTGFSEPAPLESFGEINNEDFTKKVTVPYSAYEDYFKRGQGDSLSEESLARADVQRLDLLSAPSQGVNKAISLCYQKQFEKAFFVLDQYYKKYVKHPSYWNQMATCYLLKGDDKKALLFYNKALDLDKKYAPPVNNMGILYLKEKRIQKALLSFEEAAKLNPYSMTPLFNIAQITLEYGLSDKALEYFEVLFKKDPNDTDVLNGLGTALLFQGNYERSKETFERIQRRKMKRPSIGLNYSLTLMALGLKNQAKRAFLSVEKNDLGKWKDYYKRVSDLMGEL